MQAIDAALSIYRRPVLVRRERRKVLPDNILPLIRIAGGGDVAPEFLTAERAKSAAEARDASVFYIQQVLLAPKSDEYRQLGLTVEATPQQINEHKRHMLKWLHPDRNPNKWETALFHRVATAAEKLENHTVAAATPADRNLNTGSFSSIRSKPHMKLSRNHAQIRTQKKHVRRWLRTSITIGFAFFIVLLVAWRIYVGRWFEWHEAQMFLNLSSSLGGWLQTLL